MRANKYFINKCVFCKFVILMYYVNTITENLSKYFSIALNCFCAIVRNPDTSL